MPLNQSKDSVLFSSPGWESLMVMSHCGLAEIIGIKAWCHFSVLTAFASSILPLTMHVMNLLIWSFAVCTCFALVFRKKLILSCTSFLLNVSASTQAKLHAAIACGIDIQVAPNVMYWAPHVSNFWRSGDFHVLIFISLCPDTFHFSWALRGSRPEAPYHGPIPLVREAFCGTEQLGWPLTNGMLRRATAASR